mmetsp:Transcript_23136/g.66384  ORF Transcript_23136/g.66384 Transcript_23136/m.66384 type:complete len:349 (+) Transcript_23136:1663-2709(+)
MDAAWPPAPCRTATSKLAMRASIASARATCPSARWFAWRFATSPACSTKRRASSAWPSKVDNRMANCAVLDSPRMRTSMLPLARPRAASASARARAAKSLEALASALASRASATTVSTAACASFAMAATLATSAVVASARAAAATIEDSQACTRSSSATTAVARAAASASMDAERPSMRERNSAPVTCIRCACRSSSAPSSATSFCTMPQTSSLPGLDRSSPAMDSRRSALAACLFSKVEQQSTSTARAAAPSSARSANSWQRASSREIASAKSSRSFASTSEGVSPVNAASTFCCTALPTSSAHMLRSSPWAMSCKALSFHIGVKAAFFAREDSVLMYLESCLISSC